MRTYRSDCSLTTALDIIGDKWSLIIIRDIIILRKKTFTEFLKSNEKIATNILANRLEKLTRHSLLKFTKMPNDKKTKIYYLTDSGIDLFRIVLEMILWSHRNLDKTFGPITQRLISESKIYSSNEIFISESTAYRSYRQNILAKAKNTSVKAK